VLLLINANTSLRTLRIPVRLLCGSIAPRSLAAGGALRAPWREGRELAASHRALAGGRELAASHRALAGGERVSCISSRLGGRERELAASHRALAGGRELAASHRTLAGGERVSCISSRLGGRVWLSILISKAILTSLRLRGAKSGEFQRGWRCNKPLLEPPPLVTSFCNFFSSRRKSFNNKTHLPSPHREGIRIPQ
jgi:hypothetical protein